METTERKVKFAAAALFVFTAVLHGILVMALLPPSELAKYPVAASRYLKGELHGERLLDFSPLYLQVHVVAQKLSQEPARLVTRFHVFCAAAAAAVFFLLLARYFPFWIALAGALAFILDRGLIAYVQPLEPEPVMIVLMLLFAFFVTSGRAAGPLAGGLFLGLAVLTRPNFLPLLFFIPVYFYFDPGRKKRFAAILAFALPVVVCLAGLWVRNASVVGYFSPFVMNPGTALFEGNNPNSWGFSSIYPPLVDETARMVPQESDYQHATYRMIARKVAGKDLTLPEVNRYWTGIAWNYLSEHPARALQLLGLKVFHFFHSYQWHDLSGPFWNVRWLESHYFPSVPFSIVSALALAGMLLAARKWKTLLPFYAIFFTQFVFMMVIYVSARQRASVLWVFILFACCALEYLVVHGRRIAVAGLLLVPLAALLQWPTDLMEEETRLWLSIRRSNALLGESYRLRSQDQLAEAAAASAASLASAPFYLDTRRPANLSFPASGYAGFAAAQLQPSDTSTVFDQAVLLLDSGDAAGAEARMQRVLQSGFQIKRDFYQSSEPHYYMARAALLNGDRAKAVELLQEADRRSPGDPESLALFYVIRQNEEDAGRLIRYFGELDARFYIGRAAVAAGAGGVAVTNLEYVCRMLPDFRRGRLYLAAAYGMAGRVPEGEAEYRAAMKMASDPVMLEKESIALFASVAAERPGDAFAQYSYGVVLRQFGRYNEALDVQNRALALGPSGSIEGEIAALKRAMAGLPPAGARSKRP